MRTKAPNVKGMDPAFSFAVLLGPKDPIVKYNVLAPQLFS